MSQAQGQPAASSTGPVRARVVAIGVAAAAALLTIVVAALLVIDCIEIRRSDPLNTPQFAHLRHQAGRNPKDRRLTEQIRQLDLAVRREHFGYVTLARHGNWLLLGCFGVFVAALRAGAVRARPGRGHSEGTG